MLADNVIYLKKNYPDIYKAQQEFDENHIETAIFLEETKKDNAKTLKVSQVEQSVYLHSKYDPVREAETLINKVSAKEVIDENTHVIFYGVGLGYHIETFLKHFPKTAYTLYEPSIEVFSQLLSYKSLKNITSKNLRSIICEYNLGIMTDYFSTIISNTDKRTIIVELPVYEKVFADRHDQFIELFKKYLQDKRNSLGVEYGFKKRWIINSVNNFSQVLNTPNILMENNNVFQDKAVILVSAGPSLDYEIENLRLIKEKGLAFIFSVGSAINTLLHYDIYPDAMCSYDPTEKNQMVFEKVNEMGIVTIPMIFGTSIGYEVLEQYKGPKFHMITTQDTVSKYFLKTKNEEDLMTVNDAPSIAVVALELLQKLKFGQIILAGQNLAYMGEKNYAGGIAYHQEAYKKDVNSRITTKDVNGNEIETSNLFNRMRSQMELYIKNYKMNVINTTIDGAYIEGAKFVPLKTVIKKSLQEKNVGGEEFVRINNSEDLYDCLYLKEKLTQLNKELISYEKILFDIKKILIKLNESIKNNNSKLASAIHIELDKAIKKMEANDFFNVLALPINRVEYEILANNVQRIKKEKNEFIKAKQILKPTEIFVNHLYLDSDLNQKIMEVLTNNVNNYINERKI